MAGRQGTGSRGKVVEPEGALGAQGLTLSLQEAWGGTGIGLAQGHTLVSGGSGLTLRTSSPPQA